MAHRRRNFKWLKTYSIPFLTNLRQAFGWDLLQTQISLLLVYTKLTNSKSHQYVNMINKKIIVLVYYSTVILLLYYNVSIVSNNIVLYCNTLKYIVLYCTLLY